MENEIPPNLSTDYSVPKKPEIVPPAPPAPSITPPVQASQKQIEQSPSKQKPFLVRLFKTKSSAFLTILCLGIVLKYIQASLPIHFLIGIASLSIVFVVVVIALLLAVFGYKKEAGNALYSILIGIGVVVALAIIGFGLCLISGSHW